MILQTIKMDLQFATRVLVLMIGFCVCAIPVVAQKVMAPLANPDLDQCANGPQSGPYLPCTGANWQNGNLNGGNSQYVEGQSVTYRSIYTGTVGNSGSLLIEYDTTKSGKHAMDYLTSFDRTNTLGDGNDPCNGVAGCSLGTFTTFPIPTDSDVTNGPNGIPGGGDDITQVPGNFTLFGGTITSVSAYGLSGVYTGDSTRSITVNFTFNSANVVLAWGGHIARRFDWGINWSAIAIPGSPYHTAVNSGANCSVQVTGVIFPAAVTIVKLVRNFNGSFFNTVRSFGFTSSSNFGTTSFSLMDTDPLEFVGGSTSNSNVVLFGAGNAITITENDPSLPGGYSLSNLVCTEVGGGIAPVLNTTVSFGTRTANIIADEGEFITCTFTNAQLGPSAAMVPISGRVLTSSGRGISSVRVTLTDEEGFTRTAISSSFGYYRFEGVEVGRVYVMSALSKRFQFSPQVISLTDELTGFNLIAQE